MFKKLLVFGAATLLGSCIAKSCIVFGMAAEQVKNQLKDAKESKATEQES